MIEFLIDLLNKLIEWLEGFLPEPPEEPVMPPFFIGEMRDAHPDVDDFAVVYEAIAKQDTYLLRSTGKRNEKGRLILEKVKEQKVDAGKRPELYRWAFHVDAGVVRELRWHIDGEKLLANVRHFSAPGE